ncbi:hypothetical protein HDU97_000161 [Phlyctochytrium planicorne]|nr:hypothetical protein HDU97_000161 [Phlyctochytrium planicorne]
MIQFSDWLRQDDVGGMGVCQQVDAAATAAASTRFSTVAAPTAPPRLPGHPEISDSCSSQYRREERQQEEQEQRFKEAAAKAFDSASGAAATGKETQTHSNTTNASTTATTAAAVATYAAQRYKRKFVSDTSCALPSASLKHPRITTSGFEESPFGGTSSVTLTTPIRTPAATTFELEFDEPLFQTSTEAMDSFSAFDFFPDLNSFANDSTTKLDNTFDFADILMAENNHNNNSINNMPAAASSQVDDSLFDLLMSGSFQPAVEDDVDSFLRALTDEPLTPSTVNWSPSTSSLASPAMLLETSTTTTVTATAEANVTLPLSTYVTLLTAIATAQSVQQQQQLPTLTFPMPVTLPILPATSSSIASTSTTAVPSTPPMTPAAPSVSSEVLNSDDETWIRAMNPLIRKIVRDGKEAHQCPVDGCNHVGERRYNVTTHLRTHLAKRERGHRCGQCGRSYIRKYELDRHVKRKHQ